MFEPQHLAILKAYSSSGLTPSRAQEFMCSARGSNLGWQYPTLEYF